MPHRIVFIPLIKKTKSSQDIEPSVLDFAEERKSLSRTDANAAETKSKMTT